MKLALYARGSPPTRVSRTLTHHPVAHVGDCLKAFVAEYNAFGFP